MLPIKVGITVLLCHLVYQTTADTKTDPGSLNGVAFQGGQDAVLECTKGGGCKYGELDVTGTNKITINCRALYSCIGFVVKAPAGQDKVVLNCLAKNACREISLQTATAWANEPKMVINTNAQTQSEGFKANEAGACVCAGVRSDTLPKVNAAKCCNPDSYARYPYTAKKPYNPKYKGSQGVVSETKKELAPFVIPLKQGHKKSVFNEDQGMIVSAESKGTYKSRKGTPMLYGKKTKKAIHMNKEKTFYVYFDGEKKVPDEDLPGTKTPNARAEYMNDYWYYNDGDELEYGMASAPVVPGYGYGGGYEAGGDQGMSWMYWVPVVVMMMCMCGLCAFCGGGVLGYFIGVFMRNGDKMSYQSVQQEMV